MGTRFGFVGSGGLAAAAFVAAGLVALAGATAPGAGGEQPGTVKPADKSLYERLGGIDAVALVVDDFVNRLATNPTVTANPKVKEALGKVSVPGLKFKLCAQISEASGGPYKYFGKSMKDSHKGMKITDAEWEATVTTLKASLDKFKVASREQSDLLGAIRGMKNDIVGQ